MTRTIVIWALVATLGALWGVSSATAQTAPPPTQTPPQTPAPSPTPSPTPEPSAVIISTSPQPILVGGMEVDKSPVGVLLGTNVCIEDSTYYASDSERWTFQGWSSGSTQECIAPTRQGTYRALFTHEVLIVVHSAAAAYQTSQWVTAGTPVSLEVPPIVTVPDDSRSRYRFLQWSDGETPFQPQNTIAPVKPMVIEAKWAFEHQVTVQGPPGIDLPGSGWYADGSNLVLQAPDSLPGASDSERQKFVRWEPAGYPSALIGNPTTSQATLKIDAGYTVRAVFQKQYMVDARNPAGSIKHDWVDAGSDLVIETPPTLDIVPDQERLVFKSWQGVDNVQSPRFGGPVDQPLKVTAVYDHEVMLKVDAPYGVSGDGWQKIGSVATISVPDSVNSWFLFRSTFTGFSAHPSNASSIQVLMDHPVSVSALYRTEVDLPVLAVTLLVPFGAFVILMSYRWVPALWRRRPRLRSRAGFKQSEQEVRYASRS